MASKTILELFDENGKKIYKASFHSDFNTSDTMFFKTESGAKDWLESFTN